MAQEPQNPPSIPNSLDRPLDVLVAGGGPCGTAVAFRSMELGMSALVIELDDLLKRIRDYAKDKQILPGFGGGDQQKFPAGGVEAALPGVQGSARDRDRAQRPRARAERRVDCEDLESSAARRTELLRASRGARAGARGPSVHRLDGA